MTVIERTALLTQMDTNIAPNTTGDIGAADIRDICRALNEGYSWLEDAAAATSLITQTFRRTTTHGTPAIGIGAGVQFEVETAAGNNEIGAIIEAITTNVGSGTEAFDLVFKTMTAGNAATEAFKVTGVGNMIIAGSSLTIGGTEVVIETRTVSGGTGLEGGGALSSNQTITHKAHTGDVTGSTALTIGNDKVTYAKMQNVVADERLLGNVSGAGAIVAELNQATVLTFLGIEASATADQSDAEIETAYNNRVTAMSQATAEAGSSTTIERITAERIKQAIAALSQGGIGEAEAMFYGSF